MKLAISTGYQLKIYHIPQKHQCSVVQSLQGGGCVPQVVGTSEDLLYCVARHMLMLLCHIPKHGLQHFGHIKVRGIEIVGHVPHHS